MGEIVEIIAAQMPHLGLAAIHLEARGSQQELVKPRCRLLMRLAFTAQVAQPGARLLIQARSRSRRAHRVHPLHCRRWGPNPAVLLLRG
jgi:hypothetical protein